jgi:hypothetical protein
MLHRLASIVGADGTEITQRVVRALAWGNARPYYAELNRLTDRFIASLQDRDL